MDDALSEPWPMNDANRQISQAFDREGARLRRFVGSRVDDRSEAEEIVQEVFFELVEAYRWLKHPEQVTAWLYRVARNRITDLFRRRGREAARSPRPASGDESEGWLDLLPSPEAGPDAELARRVLLDELARALAELPREQRDAFVAHELDGESFKEMAARTGVGINTLLARKRYAVLRLRRRLQAIHDEVKGR